MNARDTILERLDSVPSLPAAVIELRKYLSDPEVTFGKLAKVIEYDPGLTANVLQLANSAYFGWSQTVGSVEVAIARLGTRRIFQMALCMSVASIVRRPIVGYDLDGVSLWEHSIATAICAEQLVAILGLRGLDDAFTAGLLHDMGKVVLGTFIEVDDSHIKELVHTDGLCFNEAERMVLGIDHAEVAGELLKAWNLPDSVVEAAFWHHQPQSAPAKYQSLVDVVHVADFLCINFGFGVGCDGLYYKLDERSRARLGLKVSHAEDAGSRTMMAVAELDEMFSAAKRG